MDAYDILGIDRESTKEKIEKAYRRLALLHHPDKNGDSEKFDSIRKSYEYAIKNIERDTFLQRSDPLSRAYENEQCSGTKILVQEEENGETINYLYHFHVDNSVTKKMV